RPTGLTRVRREVSGRAVRGDEAARRARRGAGKRRGDPAEGRAVRRPRRADAPLDGRMAPRHLAAHPQDRHLHHTQPARGALAVDSRRGDDCETGADQGGARAADGAPALDGVARDGGASRQALERDPRGIAEGHAVKVVLLRLGLLAALLAAWELAGGRPSRGRRISERADPRDRTTDRRSSPEIPRTPASWTLFQ